MYAAWSCEAKGDALLVFRISGCPAQERQGLCCPRVGAALKETICPGGLMTVGAVGKVCRSEYRSRQMSKCCQPLSALMRPMRCVIRTWHIELFGYAVKVAADKELSFRCRADFVVDLLKCLLS